MANRRHTLSGCVAVILVLAGTALAQYGVTVTSPANQSDTPNNVHFAAYAASPYAGIAAMVINIDSQDKYVAWQNSLDTYLNLPDGQHQVVMKAWDLQGHYFDQWLYITAGGNGQTVISDIQNMQGWNSCDSCAGPGGRGHTDVHYQVQNIGNPSFDGLTSQFYLGHTTDGNFNYSNALWFKRLQGSANATHFVMDFYMYVQDPSVAQGIEMDIFYARDGWKNYFLTECDSRGMYAGTWQVSDAVHDQWQHTGLPCVLQPYSWNHITLEFYRNPDGSTRFVSLTLNGDKQYVNRNYAALAVSDWDFELNPAIQLDGDERQDPYSVWIDKMSVTYW